MTVRKSLLSASRSRDGRVLAAEKFLHCRAAHLSRAPDFPGAWQALPCCFLRWRQCGCSCIVSPHGLINTPHQLIGGAADEALVCIDPLAANLHDARWPQLALPLGEPLAKCAEQAPQNCNVTPEPIAMLAHGLFTALRCFTGDDARIRPVGKHEVPTVTRADANIWDF